jgi:hypothetical protein
MIGQYTHRDADRDAATNLLERRWFSSLAAVRAMQTECEILQEALQLAEAAWRRAQSQLAEYEALSDALGDELAACDGVMYETAEFSQRRAATSAA